MKNCSNQKMLSKFFDTIVTNRSVNFCLFFIIRERKREIYNVPREGDAMLTLGWRLVRSVGVARWHHVA